MHWNKKYIVMSMLLVHMLTYNKQSLNILFIVGHFPTPSQVFILNIMTGLIDLGHKVSICALHKDTSLPIHPNVEKYKLMDRVKYTTLSSKLPKCDIVFCQFGYLGKLLLVRQAKFAKSLKKRKLVVCFRGSDTSSYVQKDPKIYKKLFIEANLLLPVCDYFKQKLIRLGCGAQKIEVYHSAIDCAKFFFTPRNKPEEGTINIVSVCRLVKKKGVDDAIKAFAEVSQKYPQLRYSIVGDGQERTYLELLVYQYGLQDKITFHGWKSQDEIVSILHNSHIFLLPSRRADDGNEEGIPNALKEAMAMGLIAIGTWHAGTPELIEHGTSGFLVPEKNIFQLSSIIEHILEHPEVWQEIGLAGRKKVEKEFETKRSVKQLEKLFYRLLAQN
ncbi:MAG TPA: glycosyltransferase [Candidatus Babeliales bacterium]|nr:glycosyltransferase [Candidatus Babeliales bacterium]